MLVYQKEDTRGIRRFGKGVVRIWKTVWKDQRNSKLASSTVNEKSVDLNQTGVRARQINDIGTAGYS